ncbi:MAG: flavodoxin FldA [Ardenticatenia bacterium]|nr:flavodoxin FldA [Ardenticatenia bacterium]
MKIGIFVGSTTGNSAGAAEAIQKEFNKKLPGATTVLNVKVASPSQMSAYDFVIIGCPTWNVGELQEDWAAQFSALDAVNFSGRKVAFFGCGDQVGYINNFQDAMGILGNKVVAMGAEVYGFWSYEGYDFALSEGIVDDHFVGLALDDDNQSQKTQGRIEAWVKQLCAELGIP